MTLCPEGSVCVVVDGEATCVRADLVDNNACARADIECLTPGSTCEVVDGKPTSVSALPPGANNPCENSPCGPATGTICVVVHGEAQCLPNVVG